MRINKATDELARLILTISRWLFIQVIRTPQSKQSSKLKQCEYLEKTINGIFKTLDHRVHRYSFHHGTPENFLSGEDRRTLREEILDFLANPKRYA